MPAHIAVAAPEDLEWIRASAAPLVVVDDVAAAQVVVTTVDRIEAIRATVARRAIVVIGEPRDFCDAHVAHVIRRGLPSEQVLALLSSLVGLAARRVPLPNLDTPASARHAERAFLLSRRLAASTDLIQVEATAVAAVLELTGADRAHCLFHDPDDGWLWSESRLREEGDHRRSTAGLAGFAARTGDSVVADRAGSDLRWLSTIDDEASGPNDRLLVQPIVSWSGAVHAVLVAARRGRRPAFSEADAELLARYAALAAPFVDQLSTRRQGMQLLDDRAEDDGLFRREALAAQARERWGDIIRVMPPWMGRAYWVLVVLLVGALGYMSLGTVATYSGGPAVIRATARTEVVARSSGNVTSVETAPGEQVVTGAVIARLDDQNQQAALVRAQEEFASQLRNHMLDPSDPVADGALRELRQEREAALAQLEDRIVRAASSGTIADLRVHPGQHVRPGNIVASIVEGGDELELVALLPGEDRPQLAPGMTMRLQLRGYRYAYQQLDIESVSSDVIGPGEARRVLGPEIADSIDLAGPVVLVRGRLPRSVFDADGRTFQYHDGMRGTAEVRVRVDRILFTLLPWLKGL